MVTSYEKVVKYTIKTLAKSLDLDYEELKNECKKVLKMSKKLESQLYGVMEDLLELGNVGSEEELDEFDIEVLKVYCKIKDLDETLTDKTIRSNVWKSIQEEFEFDDDDDEEDDLGEDDDLDEEDDDLDEDPEIVEIEKTKSVESSPKPSIIKKKRVVVE